MTQGVQPIVESQNQMKKMLDGISKTEISKVAARNNELIEKINENNALKNMSETLKLSNLYVFKPAKVMSNQIKLNISNSVGSAIQKMTQSYARDIEKTLNSVVGNWLQTIDFSPLRSIVESINQQGYAQKYKELKKIYMQSMFEARWFPYAGRIATSDLFEEIITILGTSRASKNRIKRIDKALFSYYDKAEMDNIKRSWRNKELPSYMKRILVQSIQAYHRREYALTVSALSTLWEGIIQEKANDNGYRISRKTRENLSQLIDRNEYDKIFASFCDEFIFYNCTKPEDVKEDVPGRHGIAHCWYDKYPSRKVALNAILFTDFLLELTPLDKTEEETA